jgi:hypothetical protein
MDAPPVELVARLPKGVSASDFEGASPALQELILAKATVVSVDDFTASQVPHPPDGVVVSLPAGVTCAEFAGAPAAVRQIIKGASSVSKKRHHIGSMVTSSAADLQARVLSTADGAKDRLRNSLVSAVSHDNVKSVLLAKQPRLARRVLGIPHSPLIVLLLW